MDELKDIAPELSKLNKENPFVTPENYFDDFSARLHMKIEAEKSAVPKKQFRIINILKPAIGLAASFALIFLLVYWPLKTFMPMQVAETAEQTEYSDYEILNIVEDMDEGSFFALLEESNGTNKFSDEDLVAYVSANFTDYEIFENTEK
ncbi:MAG: hypothetical protein ABFS16_09700 [Bacteroidota bacterium]